MRGQAFVVFETPTIANAAKRALSGFSFYGKGLDIEYSTGGKSRALLRRELGEEAVMEMELEQSRTTVSRRGDKRLFLAGEEEGESGEGRKRVKLEQTEEGGVVYARNIPRSIEETVLTTLFSARTGFVDITEVKNEDDTWSATIKFDSQQTAQAAQSALHGVQLDPMYTLDLHVS